MGKIQKKAKGITGTTESVTRVWGKVIFYLGMIGISVCIVMSGEVTKINPSDSWGENGYNLLWICFGFIVVLFASGVFSTLRILCEIVRLLKKLNGLPYGGKIRGWKTFGYYCPECDTEVEVYSVKCEECGLELEKDEANW